MTATVILSAALGVALIVALVLGIVAHRRRRQLRELADYDLLTELPTRRLLAARLAAALAEGQRTTVRIAVLALEVRGFTHLNDTYGREVGDEVMSAVADVLRRTTRTEEYLVRFGGPRFVVVCPDVGDRRQAEDRARELLAAVQRPYDLGRDRIRLSASVGLTITDQRTSTPDEVLLDATVALDQALDDGRGAVRSFEASARGAWAPSTAEHRLRQALDDGEFWLLYLPVLSLADQRLVGVEAVLRWADPRRGLVSPLGFVHSLNETGLIVPIGDWVFREAARQSRAWQEEFDDRPPLETTVNFSPRQLMQADVLEHVQAAVAETGADPAHLCLEVADGALAHEPEDLWTTLRQAKQLGFKVGLDGFGGGYSPLTLLRRFKLDRLKIDRSFVTDLPHNPDDRTIVGHLVGLAHELGMVPVAEGIETADQATALHELGCPLGQGTFFSTPQPPAVISSLLARGQAALDEAPPVVVDVTTTGATKVPGQL